MNLEHATARLRPRLAWEAVDLGVALFQRHFGVLVRTWAALVLPVILALGWLTRERPWLFGILLFWVKPVFERVPVFVLGRSLFGPPPTLGATARALRTLWGRHLGLGLFSHRVNPQRGLLTPIVVLEGVTGRALRDRQRVIAGRNGSTAMLVAVAGAHFETLILILLIALGSVLIPDEFLPRSEQVFELLGSDRTQFGILAIALQACAVAVYSLNGLVHASCGFALYIDQRAHLEGWDVEVAFRRLAADVPHRRRTGVAPPRVVSTLVLALTACLVGSASGHHVFAQNATPSKEQVRTALSEVLDHEDFGGETTERRWVWDNERNGETAVRPNDDVNDSELPAVPSLRNVSEVAGETTHAWRVPTFVLVLIGAAFAWFALQRWRALRRSSTASARDPELTLDVMGLDLRPTSIPDDVRGGALAAFDGGDAQAAISLLYRAALSRLVHDDGLRLLPGDTEGDCARRVDGTVDTVRAEAFRAVTGARIQIAYAFRPLSRERLTELCDLFDAHFPLRSAA